MEKTTYTKEELAKSKRFSDRTDLLLAVLSDEERYTAEEAEKLIKRYLKGKVN